VAQRDRHVGGLSAVSGLQPLHNTRHAALPGLFAEQGSLQFLVAYAAGDAGARIIPARRQASGTLTGQHAQAVRGNSVYSNYLSAKCQEWFESDNFK
jgi:hypothetical protein